MNKTVTYEPARWRDADRLAAGADVAAKASGVGACDRELPGVRAT